MTQTLNHAARAAILVAALGGCGGTDVADNCANADGALSDASFVITTAPRAGDRVASGFAVKGCSRTFESTVNWRLLGRNGSELASGHSQGGGVDGPGPFSFSVTYSVPAQEIGHLEVFEEDVSDGEGNPPGRNVLPLVLKP
ncbi:MAG TPA: Gmad2 immunoglobulin-like domain-containing protein [Methyloceanibacter sp.]|nr:Gmad2 immunoglobulin-like domain-containing protein [Methyloceanibacter sp.]